MQKSQFVHDDKLHVTWNEMVNSLNQLDDKI